MATDQHEMIAAAPPSIWGNRNLVLLWMSQLVSLFGDYIFYIAVIWLALEVTGDNGIAGLVSASIYLPMIVVGLAGGSLVDRWDRRRTMILADAARCLLMLAFPLLFWAGYLNAIVIAALAFAVESFSCLFLPARDVLIGELTPKAQLTSANALVQSAAPIAMIAGPAAAGLLLPFIGIAHLFTVDAVTFAASLVLLLAMSRMPRRLKREGPRTSLITEIRAGIRYASRHSLIRWLLLITAVDNWFIMGPAIIGIPILVRDIVGGPHVVLGITLDAAQIYAGTVVTFAAGFILASALIHHLNLRLNRGRILLLGIFLDGATYVPLGWITDPLTIFALMFVHGLAVPMIVNTRTSLVQEFAPKELQGRVFAMINLTVKGVTALSVGATGFIAMAMGINYLFAIWGAVATLLGPLGWAVRSLREAGAETHG